MKQKKKQLSLSDLEDLLFDDDYLEEEYDYLDDDDDDISYESAMEP
jgi:hypothetical protein